MYGLVLAGGGARGAYEIGVWQALEEMRIEIGAVCGTSIGSINGAVFAQGDAKLAEELWRGISAEDIVELGNLEGDNLFSLKNLGAVLEEVRKNKGISMKPLEKILRKIIDEEKLLSSPVDFGLVTYSLTDVSEIAIFKNDIPRGKLVDYIMASACMPGIKTKVIGEKAFVDGGVTNNKPVGMLAERGYRDIIAVDVGGYGIVKPVKNSGINIIEIKCKVPEMGIMQFDSELIARSIKGGYLDAKRAFAQLCGRKYAFRTADYTRTRKRLSFELIDGLEAAAEIYGIDSLREYTVASLSRKVCNEYKKMCSRTEGLTLEAMINENNRARLLTYAATRIAAGETDIFNSKLVGNIFKDFSRAVNALAYFSYMR